jgi:hypothetical protein
VADFVCSSLGKVASSFTKPAQSVSSTVAASASATYSSTTTIATTSDAKSATQAHATPVTAHSNHIQAPEWEQGEQEDEVRRVARETVAEDLKDWQERYTKAADEGAAEIEDRVDEISKRLIRRNARTTGKAQLEQLKSTVVSELVTLRRDIQNIIGAVSKGNAKQTDAQEQITSVVRRAGMAIKEKAQGVREWRENYETELHSAINTAADNHFKILDSIRDLAIQKIGMKWAWTDGITYRDWQKYHLLKDRFDEWHGDLEHLIVSHPGLQAAQLEGATIEEEAMTTAQSAAKELARLKQVANWKLAAADATDEFDDTLMKRAADIAESAKTAATSAAGNVAEKVEDAAGSVVEAISEAAPVFEPSAAVESATSAVSSGASSVASSAKSIASSVSDGASSVLDKTSTLENIASKGAASASSAAQVVSSEASKSVSKVAEAASSGSAMVNSAGEAVSSKASTAVSHGSKSVSSAGGAASSKASAAASKVSKSVSGASQAASSKASEAVDYATDAAAQGSERLSNAASSAASTLSEGLSSATDVASSVTSKASGSAAAAISDAEAAVPKIDQKPSGTDTNLASSATEMILTETPVYAGNTSEFEEEGPAPVVIPVEGVEMEEPVIVDDSDEDGLHSTPTPSPSVKRVMFGAAAQVVPNRQIIIDDDTYDSVASGMSELPATVSEMAHSAYSAAVSQANAHYSQALSVVSVQIHGTPKPAHEQMLASVTSAYSNAMSSASSKLDAAMKVASGQFAATPTTNNFFPTSVPLPNVPSVEWAQIESIASDRLAQGRAWAEEQYESAKIRIGLATPTPSTAPEHVQKLLENARHNYYAGLGVAYARYSEFLSAASSAVSSMTATPTPTDFAGTASSLASVASESAASAAAAAGENVSAAASVASASALSAATAASASAASVASVASASAASVASVAGASAASAASVVGENVSSVAAAGYDAASAGYDSAASVASLAASVVGENVSSAAAAGYDAASAGYESAASVAAAGYDAAASGYENVAAAAGVAGDTVAQNWDNVVNQLSIRVYGAPTPTPWYESMYSVLGDYAASATEGAASATSTAGDYASAATAQAGQQYHVVSSIISELVVGKEPTFSESVFSRLNAAYTTGVASAASLASAAQESAASGISGASEAMQSVGEKVASVASEATEVVASVASGATASAKHERDEL